MYLFVSLNSNTQCHLKLHAPLSLVDDCVDCWNDIVALLSSNIFIGHSTLTPASSALHNSELASFTASENAHASAVALLSRCSNRLFLTLPMHRHSIQEKYDSSVALGSCTVGESPAWSESVYSFHWSLRLALTTDTVNSGL
jgi:hypothetical protein